MHEKTPGLYMSFYLDVATAFCHIGSFGDVALVTASTAHGVAATVLSAEAASGTAAVGGHF